MRAKEALFRRHARLVNGLAFRLLGRDQDLDELVQDVFVEALRGLPGLREPAAFSSWIGAIVVHKVRRRIRRRRFAAAIGLGSGGDNPDVEAVAAVAPAETVVELRRVYARIERLSTEERIALLLHRVEGYTLPDVAARMSLSLATVKRRLSSAAQKLGGGEAA